MDSPYLDIIRKGQMLDSTYMLTMLIRSRIQNLKN